MMRFLNKCLKISAVRVLSLSEGPVGSSLRLCLEHARVSCPRPHFRFISQQIGSNGIGLKKKQRPPGGERFLKDPSLVFSFNNWDNVEWDEEQECAAREKVQQNSTEKLPSEDQEEYEFNSGHYWNEFYAQHQNRFFKDRHWLFTEFPELAPACLDESPACSDESPACSDESSAEALSAVHDGQNEKFPGEHASFKIFEVGCGVGNTVFPILQTSNDPKLFIYCCDLSNNAIELVKENQDYSSRRCHAFVCNVADPGSSFPFPEESLDVIVLVFVLSAINPEKAAYTVARLSRFLKPGGLFVFRDYGRYDLTQLRFKTGRCLGDNFYVRGDGTKVYFSTQEELRKLFTDAGLVEEQNLIDRRLQVNRGKQIKMYRIWIQCKYRKPKTVAIQS